MITNNDQATIAALVARYGVLTVTREVQAQDLEAHSCEVCGKRAAWCQWDGRWVCKRDFMREAYGT